ncbi:MAG: 1-acyl-sn-glycerol-3-phosphate acyltransferase [Myxococcales bacterium]|nr:1-acyl-sn-glycerol-3-phosphate acyltransferase [Myxococcales bacterium]
MGILLSAQVIGETARLSFATFARGVTTGVRRETADATIRALGDRIVRRADIRVAVATEVALDGARPHVYMSNHQSLLDIPVLAAALPAQSLRFVAKAELFRIPVFGKAMRSADIVELDRGDHARARASLDRAAALMASGISVWIAPEGTRSPDGRLAPLKKGGFHLALAAGVPIVPVALNGTGAVLRKNSLDMRRGCPVQVRIGAPIPVAGRTVEALLADVEAYFQTHVEPVDG